MTWGEVKPRHVFTQAVAASPLVSTEPRRCRMNSQFGLQCFEWITRRIILSYRQRADTNV